MAGSRDAQGLGNDMGEAQANQQGRMRARRRGDVKAECELEQFNPSSRGQP
jgi:hypothetical protein